MVFNFADYSSLHEPIFTILMPFFIIQICWAGGLFIFSSIAPSERAKAKDMLWKAMVSMVLVTVSPLIFEAMILWVDQLVDQINTIFNASDLVEGYPADNKLRAVGKIIANTGGTFKDMLSTGGVLYTELRVLSSVFLLYAGSVAIASNIIFLSIFVALILGPLIILGIRVVLLIFLLYLVSCYNLHVFFPAD